MGESILVVTGGLDIGPPDSPKGEKLRRSYLEHGIPFEELDGAEANRRFPGYRIPESLRAIYQADAGYVRSEVAIRAHSSAARELGADAVPFGPERFPIFVLWAREGIVAFFPHANGATRRMVACNSRDGHFILDRDRTWTTRSSPPASPATATSSAA